QAAGIRVLGTATTVAEAVHLAEHGADAIIATGSEAGGHRVSFLRPAEDSLVGTFVLVPQVVDAVEVPVVAAGGIADRRGVAAALALGADGVLVGTAFLRTRQSAASQAHRQAIAARSEERRVGKECGSPGAPARERQRRHRHDPHAEDAAKTAW